MSKSKTPKKTSTTKGAKTTGESKAAPPETSVVEAKVEVPVATPVAAPVANNEGKGTTPEVVVAQLETPTKAKKSKARATKPAQHPKIESTKLSALDAAAKVLADVDEPMTTKAMIEAMAAKKLWTSPGGKTPAATLYSAILREITVKGKESRFRKADKGLFAFVG